MTSILAAQASQLDRLLDALGGGAALLYGLLALLLLVLWILFPFIVWRQLSQLIRLGRRQNDLLEDIARQTRPADRRASEARDSALSYHLAERPGIGMPIFIGAMIVAGLITAVIYARR